MTRQLFDTVSREWLAPDEYYFRKAANSQLLARSDLPAPLIMGSDTIEPTQSMADGRYYTSKSSMRHSYKASGNPQGVQYTEVGNDPAWKRMERPQPKPDHEGVKQAIEKAQARVNRGEKPQL